jgi:hypothetical protein
MGVRRSASEVGLARRRLETRPQVPRARNPYLPAHETFVARALHFTKNLLGYGAKSA